MFACGEVLRSVLVNVIGQQNSGGLEALYVYHDCVYNDRSIDM